MSNRLNVGSRRKKLFSLASVVLHVARTSVVDPFIIQLGIAALVITPFATAGPLISTCKQCTYVLIAYLASVNLAKSSWMPCL